MQYETEAIMLTAVSKPYNFGGNEGISHKIRLNIGGEIYICSSTSAQVQGMQVFAGKKGKAVVVLNSPKENLKLELLSFEE